MKNIILYTIKVIIFNLVFFTFVYSFIPRGTFSLIELNKANSVYEVLQKHLIGSLSSCFAIKEKINRNSIKSNDVLLNYGKEHLKSMCK